jgi:hypothetical protein
MNSNSNSRRNSFPRPAQKKNVPPPKRGTFLIFRSIFFLGSDRRLDFYRAYAQDSAQREKQDAGF